MDRITVQMFFKGLYIKSTTLSKRLKNRRIAYIFCTKFVNFQTRCFTPYDKGTFNNLDTNHVPFSTWFQERPNTYQGVREAAINLPSELKHTS